MQTNAGRLKRDGSIEIAQKQREWEREIQQIKIKKYIFQMWGNDIKALIHSARKKYTLENRKQSELRKEQLEKK